MKERNETLEEARIISIIDVYSCYCSPKIDGNDRKQTAVTSGWYLE